MKRSFTGAAGGGQLSESRKMRNMRVSKVYVVLYRS